MNKKTKIISVVVVMVLLLASSLYFLFLTKNKENKNEENGVAEAEAVKVNEENFCLKFNEKGVEYVDQEIEALVSRYASANGSVISKNEICASLLAGRDLASDLGDEEFYSKVFTGEPEIEEGIINKLEVYIGRTRAEEVTEELFREANDKNEELLLKTQIIMTSPYALLCIRDKGFLTEPKSGDPICLNKVNADDVWPKIEEEYGAQWGGCDFAIDKSNNTFQYCAKDIKNDILYKCTESGCEEVVDTEDF